MTRQRPCHGALASSCPGPSCPPAPPSAQPPAWASPPPRPGASGMVGRFNQLHALGCNAALTWRAAGRRRRSPVPSCSCLGLHRLRHFRAINVTIELWGARGRARPPRPPSHSRAYATAARRPACAAKRHLPAQNNACTPRQPSSRSLLAGGGGGPLWSELRLRGSEPELESSWGGRDGNADRAAGRDTQAMARLP